MRAALSIRTSLWSGLQFELNGHADGNHQNEGADEGEKQSTQHRVRHEIDVHGSCGRYIEAACLSGACCSETKLGVPL